MEKYGIIIQARTGSTRFPKKVVQPFWKTKNIVEIQIEKLKKLKLPIVLATSINPNDKTLVAIAKSNNVACYQGDEENVLSRFTAVVQKYSFERVIRVCADNPFLDIDLLDHLIQKDHKEYDYLSYALSNGTPVILSHLGLFAEIIKTEALKNITQFTNKQIYLEHVTNYLYNHPNKYNIKFLSLPNNNGFDRNIRLTIDTQSDFITAQQIAQHFDSVNITAEEILKFVISNKELMKKMEQEIIKNEK